MLSIIGVDLKESSNHLIANNYAKLQAIREHLMFMLHYLKILKRFSEISRREKWHVTKVNIEVERG